MSAIRIELPDDLRVRMEKRAAESGFDSVEAYAQAVLAADAIDVAPMSDDQLESLLLSRLDGPFVETDEADFEQMRRKLSQQLGDADAKRKP